MKLAIVVMLLFVNLHNLTIFIAISVRFCLNNIPLIVDLRDIVNQQKGICVITTYSDYVILKHVNMDWTCFIKGIR